MSKKGEFGEPWHIDQTPTGRRGRFVRSAGILLADANTPDQASRIVSCVNALDGLDPEKLGALIEAAKNALDSGNCRREDFLDTLGRRLRVLSDALDELGVPHD